MNYFGSDNRVSGYGAGAECLADTASVSSPTKGDTAPCAGVGTRAENCQTGKSKSVEDSDQFLLHFKAISNKVLVC